MLAKTITYTNFFDEDVKLEKLAYFNITKSELTENLDLINDVGTIRDIFVGEERNLTPEEIGLILKLVRRLARLSYGERDGNRFVKSQGVWDDFVQIGAFDAMITSLFENPADIMSFILGIMPRDLVEQAEREISAKEKAAEIGQDASGKELASLSKDELIELMKVRNQK